MDWRIGNLSIGHVPRVVGTISDRHTLPSGASGLLPLCNLVEVRLDTLGVHTPDWLRHSQAIEAGGLPVILTLRLHAEGGAWEEPDRDRAPILESALETLSAIDIELSSELCESLCSFAKERDKHLIVSYHNFSGTPTLPELRDVLLSIAQYPAAVPKISTMVKTDADIDVLRQLLDTGAPDHRPVCIIGMGSRGVNTRTLFPALGSCITYGYVDKPSAPGQWQASHLVQHLRDAIPEYNRDFMASKEVAGPA